MSASRQPDACLETMRSDRRRFRAQGLRPVVIWVPDTRSPAFAADAARQSRLIAQSSHEAEDQAFIDACSELKLD